MKNKKIMSAFFMLLITVVALSTASYAWFTENTTVALDDIDVNVSASNGIQISTDALNWKAAISNDDITANAYAGNTNRKPSSLVPVSTGGEVDLATGFMKVYKGAVESNGSSGNILVATKTTETDESFADFIAFDLFVLTNKAETLYLTPSANVNYLSGDEGLKNATRVAFVVEGNTAAGSSQTVATALKPQTETNAIIWEPNNNAHTPTAIAHAASSSSIGRTITATEEINSYDGVIAEMDAADAIPLNATSTNQSAYFKSITPAIKTNVTHGDDLITTVSAGITKIRVYAWVEGQDVDCENEASGSGVTFSISIKKGAAQ